MTFSGALVVRARKTVALHEDCVRGGQHGKKEFDNVIPVLLRVT
jgi:hypothetical protein